MIRGLVDFALQNRFLVLAAGVLLFVWRIDFISPSPCRSVPEPGDCSIEFAIGAVAASQ